DACGAVNALVGDLLQPAADVRVGSFDIEMQAGTLERGGQRGDEALLEVAVEALDLALGSGPVRPADPRAEAILLGKRGEFALPPMLSCAVGVALGDDAARVIEQHLRGYTPEIGEGAAQALKPGRTVLPDTEQHEGRPAVAQGGHEGLERFTTPADGGEVGLHLLAGVGLETHHWLCFPLLERCQENLELADAALVAPLLDLPQQDRCRDPAWMRCGNTLAQIVGKRIELRRAGCA